MTAISYPVSSHLVCQKKSSQVFVTFNEASWISQLQTLTKVEPFHVKIGEYLLSSVSFDRDSLPHTTTAFEFKDALGCLDVTTDPIDISSLFGKLDTNPAHLIVSMPLKVELLAPKLRLEVSKPQSHAIAISRTSSLTQAPPAQDSLGKVKSLLLKPRETHLAYAARFKNGSCGLIDEHFVTRMSSLFFSEISKISHYAAQGRDSVMLSLLGRERLILLKNEADYELCALYQSQKWHGSFKTCFLAAHFFETLEPRCLIVTSDILDSQTELKFKTHDIIKEISTPLYKTWVAADNSHLLVGWASNGTLAETLNHPLSLEIKDQLAMQLLSKMDILHQFAVHKDLNTANILINYPDDTHVELLVNDFGASCFKEEIELSKHITTNSYNLAPEILAKVTPHRGFFWESAIESDLTVEDWMLSERFITGLIILEIYTGKHIYKLIQDRSSIKQDLAHKYPLCEKQYDQLRLTTQLASYLETFFDEDDHSHHKIYYFEAFREFFNAKSTLLQEAYLEITLSKERVDISTPAKKHPLMMDAFNLVYSCPARRSFLGPFFKIHAEPLDDLYRNAFRKMKKEHMHEFYGDLAKVMLTEKRSIEELTGIFIPEIEEPIRKRLSLIYPLLDLDPTKRPLLKEVLNNLSHIIT